MGISKSQHKIISIKGSGGADPSINSRITKLEDNEYKITYFESVSSSAGTVTIPTGATIMLDQFAGGIDAYTSTIVGGVPTGEFPQTSGGVVIDVSSFDASGNYTLSGTPSAYPVAIIYVIRISALNYSNIDLDYELTNENIEYISDISKSTKLIASSNTDSTITGSTTPQVAKSLRIPAGTMGVNGVMEIRIQFKKPVTLATVQPSVYISDVDSVFTGKPEIFTPPAMNTTARFSSWRGYVVNKNNIAINNLQQVTTLFPEVASTNALLASNINFGIDQWVVVPLKLNNILDEATVDNIQVFVTNP